MTFDEVMVKHHGKWDGDKAVIMDHGGYFWIIATRNGTAVTLTTDGKRYVSDVVAEKPKARREALKPAPVQTLPSALEYDNE